MNYRPTRPRRPEFKGHIPILLTVGAVVPTEQMDQRIVDALRPYEDFAEVRSEIGARVKVAERYRLGCAG